MWPFKKKIKVEDQIKAYLDKVLPELLKPIKDDLDLIGDFSYIAPSDTEQKYSGEIKPEEIERKNHHKNDMIAKYGDKPGTKAGAKMLLKFEEEYGTEALNKLIKPTIEELRSDPNRITPPSWEDKEYEVDLLEILSYPSKRSCLKKGSIEIITENNKSKIIIKYPGTRIIKDDSQI